MIRSLTSRYVNHTQKDIIPPLYLPFNCETSENRIHLDELQLEMPLKNILTHNDELQLASYKVKEVQELRWIYSCCNHVFRSWERTNMRKETHYPPLCVGPYKPGVGRQRGDTFRESSREQSQC
jgi:hypothetical protein